MADSQSDDKIKKLQGQVQDVTDVMEKNIELGNIYNSNNAMSTKNRPYPDFTNRTQFSGGKYEAAGFWLPTIINDRSTAMNYSLLLGRICMKIPIHMR